VKDGVSSYQYMNDKERIAFRTFLGFDLSQPKDIYLHDKMTNGMVEAPRAQHLFGASPTAASTEFFSSKMSDTSDTSAATSRPPGAAIRRGTSTVGGTGGGRVGPQGSSGNYQVKILTTGNLSAGAPRTNSRTKLDLKQMDGTIFTDENSVDSRTNLGYPDGMTSNSSNSKGGRRMGDSDSEDDLNTRRIPNLSLIEEGNEFDLSMRSITMEEDLLRIGMKKDKKVIKKDGCCCSVS
jgi:hypothetical protein